MQRVSGEMAARFREFNWSATSIGPPVGWPIALRTAVEIILRSSFPTAVALGPQLLYFYNDAFIPLGGPTRHPAAIGQPVEQVFSELWQPFLKARFEETLSTGLPTGESDLLMPIMRNGYLEETYMTFSFAPLPDNSGIPNGILCTAIENTELVIARRKIDCLRRLATDCASASSPDHALNLAAAALDGQRRDLPFALLYRCEVMARVELIASSGLVVVPNTVPRQVAIDSAHDRWKIAAVAATGESALIENVAALIGPSLRNPDLIPQRALTLPIAGASGGAPAYILVTGLNPMRPVAESRDFHELVAAHLERAVNSAQMKQHAEERARELAALDRAKTVFFSNVSHELRTPLTLILEPVRQVLEGAKLERKHRELLVTAHGAGGRLLKLVNSLLKFSRIEAGRINACYLPTNLALLTADVAGMFRSAFELAGIVLRIDCSACSEPAYVDRDMWEEIIFNLLSNALKFTLGGEVSLRLRERSDGFQLEVADTGCGIAEDDVPHIFDRFVRCKARSARTVEGTGIGLSLVKELAKLHGGAIEAKSTLGVGTIMSLWIPRGSAHLPNEQLGKELPQPRTYTDAQLILEEALGWVSEDDPGSARAGLPVATASGPPAEHASSPAIDEPLHSPRERILVVDDNREMRRLLSRLLEDRWQVDTARNGVEALERIRLRAPNLVIADIMMPRMDGIEMLRAVRLEPTGAEIPVLVLSARAGEDASVEGLQAGANDYLVKPFSRRELVARIEALLAQARLRAAERLSRRRIERTLKVREEFFAALAHELRSPVATLFAWLRTLSDGRLGCAKVRDGLAAIELAAQSIRRLSEDLYDIARSDSGRMRMECRPIQSLAPLVAAVVETFVPAAIGKGIDLASSLDRDSGPVSVDPERIQQVIANLLSNAIRFTPSAGRIDVQCTRQAGAVELRVRDSGRGILTSALPHIFERYWQGDRASGDGLGLGLAISRRLVELHGGQIEALSAGEGCGATLIVRIPLVATCREERMAPMRCEPSTRVRDMALAAASLAAQEAAASLRSAGG